MPEYIYTQGTQILIGGTISLLISWIITLIFNSSEPAILFAVIPTVFAIIATYSAATESDWNLFSRWGSSANSVKSQYVGNTSAVAVWSIATLGFIIIDLILWFLIFDSIRVNLMHTLSILLTISGGILIAIGGFIAHREWGE